MSLLIALAGGYAECLRGLTVKQARPTRYGPGEASILMVGLPFTIEPFEECEESRRKRGPCAGGEARLRFPQKVSLNYRSARRPWTFGLKIEGSDWQSAVQCKS
jgi:hypothetical protein